MAGEVGEVHLHAAHMLAAGAGSGSGLPWLKAIATGVLGAAALGAAFHPRHRSCSGIMVVILLVGGAASILLDAVQALGGGVWWSAAEEWCELAVYSVVAGLIIPRVVTSHIDTIHGASRAGGRALTS